MRRQGLLPVAQIRMDRWPFDRVLPLVEHLRAGGSVPPIHVRANADGTYLILDGRHRMHAFKLLGRTHIPARWGEFATPIAK